MINNIVNLPEFNNNNNNNNRGYYYLKEVCELIKKDKFKFHKESYYLLYKLLEDYVISNEDLTKFNYNYHYYHDTIEDINIHIFYLALTKLNKDTNQDLIILFLKVIKILTRNNFHRENTNENNIFNLLLLLKTCTTSKHPDVTSEIANVILNLCYNESNVKSIINNNGIELLSNILNQTNLTILTNTAGALQSICFQEIGRKIVIKTKIISRLVQLLFFENNSKLKLRCVGALHNISSEHEAIHQIRKENGIYYLIEILKSDNLTLCASAAGTIQNMSRELASRMIIKDLNAIPLLIQLLNKNNTQAQICATGALMNIIGSNLSEQERKKLCYVICNILSLSIIFQNMNDLY